MVEGPAACELKIGLTSEMRAIIAYHLVWNSVFCEYLFRHIYYHAAWRWMRQFLDDWVFAIVVANDQPLMDVELRDLFRPRSKACWERRVDSVVLQPEMACFVDKCCKLAQVYRCPY